MKECVLVIFRYFAQIEVVIDTFSYMFSIKVMFFFQFYGLIEKIFLEKLNIGYLLNIFIPSLCQSIGLSLSMAQNVFQKFFFMFLKRIEGNRRDIGNQSNYFALSREKIKKLKI